MPNLAKKTNDFSIRAAIVIIAIQNFAMKYFDFFKSSDIGDWLIFVVSIGATVTIYKLVIAIHQRWAWRVLHPECVLEGEWTNKLIPHNDTPNDDCEGTFAIEQTPFGLKFVRGRNTSSSDTKLEVSTWRSVAVMGESSTDSCVWVIYEIDRAKPNVDFEQVTDRGVFRLDIETCDEKNSANKLSGTYWDCGNKHRGRFVAEKVTSD